MLKDEEDAAPQSKGSFPLYIYIYETNEQFEFDTDIPYPITKIDEGENEQLYYVLTFTCISTTLKRKKGPLIHGHGGH